MPASHHEHRRNAQPRTPAHASAIQKRERFRHSSIDLLCFSPSSVHLLLTEKDITPMGGLPHHGVVKDDYLMIKGCYVGPKKRIITLRQTLLNQTSRVAQVR
ncbi:60S ribosomal protein L3-2 [Sesamum angolense]|uniref:60S ribosomal protein L3-2 n=1 Tax=Sesamum angolense TaxID=2727404 RepID=A0AAE1X586_9LAMI|nr:60S ribosomal protein L3-2 [Sesamum angolense]